MKGQMKLFYVKDCYTTVPVENISFRVYSDCGPHCMRTSDIQKGLVIVYRGRELIEEGVGFGVPVANYLDGIYFSKSAVTQVWDENDFTVVRKSFSMNTVLRKKLWNRIYMERSTIYQQLVSLTSAYIDSKVFGKILLGIALLKEKYLGLKTEYFKVKSRGDVIVTYTIYADKIHVSVDLTELDRSLCMSILVLNEQGSTVFRKYSDSDGLILTDDEIGGWTGVKAKMACMSSLDSSLGFCLSKVDSTKLFRGREVLRWILAWAGLNYELSPDTNVFNYTIRIICGGK